MKSVKRLLHQFQSLSRAMRQTPAVYVLRSDSSPSLFGHKAAEWTTRTITIKDDIDQALQNALHFLECLQAVNYSDVSLRNSIIIAVCNAAGYFTYLADENGSLVVYDMRNDPDAFHALIARMNTFLHAEFQTEFKISLATPDLIDILDKRIAEAQEYYIEKHGAWTQSFIDHLGDDISKISFRTFLQQRLKAFLCWDTPAMYPITPPEETAAWRQQRRDNPPQLPVIEHCKDWVKEFFYLNTFVYEQYGIAGVVEARAGQTVIDAGAYIGDTALYFSAKVGPGGKVYAFEPIPTAIRDGNDNMRRNNCTNVEIVPLALSSGKGEIHIQEAAFSSSAGASEDGSLCVKTIDIDSFVQENNIQRIDFIKSDIEGCEMELLRGAEKTIRRDAPVCGIALYHKQGDYHEIPQFLSKLCPDYTFYFRCEAEPVLLAVVPQR